MLRRMDAETMSLVRALATRIGIILEDTATTALIWAEEDQLSPAGRFRLLEQTGHDVVVIAEAGLALIGHDEAKELPDDNVSHPQA